MILLYCTEKTHITKNIFSSGHWQTFNYEKLPYAKNSKQKQKNINRMLLLEALWHSLGNINKLKEHV